MLSCRSPHLCTERYSGKIYECTDVGHKGRWVFPPTQEREYLAFIRFLEVGDTVHPYRGWNHLNVDIA